MQETRLTKAYSALFAAAVSLTTFWLLNIIKESNGGFKSFLNFYPPIGPLLGLFLFSILGFWIAYFLAWLLKIKSQKLLLVFFIGSAILFFVMVFPPIFGPVVGLLKGE